MWMTSCPEAMGWDSWWFWIKAVSWDLDLDEVSWFFGPGRGQWVCALRGAHARWLSQSVESWRWTNSQYRKIVSLSSCRKPKLKEGNKSFVPEPKETRQCFVFFEFLRVWTFYETLWMFYNVLRTSIDKIRENGFELTKKRSRRYPAKTITDADYADDIALLANTPNQAETLQHSLEQTAASIGLHVNAHKTEYMCYNQTGDISTLDGTSLKQVDKFTYLGSSVSSTEKDIDTRLTKAWEAIDKLSIIWKSDLTDKMKHSFFQAAVVSILLYRCTTWTLTKRLEKKLDGNYTRMLRAILNKSWW